MSNLQFKLKKNPVCIFSNKSSDLKNHNQNFDICNFSDCDSKKLPKGFICPVHKLDFELERARQKIFTLTNILFEKNIIDAKDLKKIGKFF